MNLEERRLQTREQPLQDRYRTSRTSLPLKNKRSCRWSCLKWNWLRSYKTLKQSKSKLIWIWKQLSNREALSEIHLSWWELIEVEELAPSRVAPQVTTLQPGLTTTWWKIVDQAVQATLPVRKTQSRTSERLSSDDASQLTRASPFLMRPRIEQYDVEGVRTLLTWWAQWRCLISENIPKKTSLSRFKHP